MRTATWSLVCTLATPLLVKVVHASNFGPYSYLSNEVSVSYAQISRDTWTWKFLNNSNTTTVTSMTFQYTDTKGQHQGVLPGSLKPRASSGGVSAFTASSRPTITIKAIKREVK